MRKPHRQPVIMKSSPETVGLTIRSMGEDDSIIYACGGFHLPDEHKQFLPDGKRKLSPGDVIQVPKEVAELYRGNKKLEFV